MYSTGEEVSTDSGALRRRRDCNSADSWCGCDTVMGRWSWSAGDRPGRTSNIACSSSYRMLTEWAPQGPYNINNMGPPVLDWCPLYIHIYIDNVSLEDHLPGSKVL